MIVFFPYCHLMLSLQLVRNTHSFVSNSMYWIIPSFSRTCSWGRIWWPAIPNHEGYQGQLDNSLWGQCLAHSGGSDMAFFLPRFKSLSYHHAPSYYQKDNYHLLSSYSTGKSRGSGFKSQLCPLLAVWPQAGDLTCLCFHVLICITGVRVLTAAWLGCSEDSRC